MGHRNCWKNESGLTSYCCPFTNVLWMDRYCMWAFPKLKELKVMGWF